MITNNNFFLKPLKNGFNLHLEMLVFLIPYIPYSILIAVRLLMRPLVLNFPNGLLLEDEFVILYVQYLCTCNK